MRLVVIGSGHYVSDILVSVYPAPLVLLRKIPSFNASFVCRDPPCRIIDVYVSDTPTDGEKDSVVCQTN
jgi:hypothetical protein